MTSTPASPLTLNLPTMPDVIGLVGFPGSGKDTLAEQLVSRGDWKRVAFADALKDAFLLARPWRTVDGEVVPVSTREELEDWKRGSDEARRALQDYGMFFRNINPYIWVFAAGDTISGYLKDGFNVIVTDIRFENEANQIREVDGQIVHLQREGHGAVNDHVSESNTAELIKRADWTLTNSGDGSDLADRLLAWLKPEQSTEQKQAIMDSQAALKELLDDLFEEIN